MGKNNQARRAAKARRRTKQRSRSRHDGQRRGPDSWRDADHPDGSRLNFDDDQVAELMWLAAARVGLGRRMTDPESARSRLADLPEGTVARVAERLLLDHVALLWQHGWQPAELHRQARLASGSGAVARLLQLALAVDCAARADQSLDARWRDQADALHRPGEATTPDWLRRWSASETSSPQESRLLVSEAIRTLFSLPAIEELVPPPGSATGPAAAAPTSDPVLQRVRNLLAKAESTEFEAEATALTAKAQELITRHAIDIALLESTAPTSEPALIRVPVDAPYADAKSLLLQTVAQATRCRAAYVEALAFSNVVGFPADLVAVEVLFTSLLVQAQHALAEAARTAAPGTRTRSQSYRSAFLLAFSGRIGERLDEINEHVFRSTDADSARFLPVLRSQHDAIEDFMRDRFGDIYASPVRGGYDPAGWVGGRMAADQARLAAGDLASTDDPQLF